MLLSTAVSHCNLTCHTFRLLFPAGDMLDWEDWLCPELGHGRDFDKAKKE
jgi:hypothetical protein